MKVFFKGANIIAKAMASTMAIVTKEVFAKVLVPSFGPIPTKEGTLA